MANPSIILPTIKDNVIVNPIYFFSPSLRKNPSKPVIPANTNEPKVTISDSTDTPIPTKAVVIVACVEGSFNLSAIDFKIAFIIISYRLIILQYQPLTVIVQVLSACILKKAGLSKVFESPIYIPL